MSKSMIVAFSLAPLQINPFRIPGWVILYSKEELTLIIDDPLLSRAKILKRALFYELRPFLYNKYVYSFSLF